MNFWIKVFLIKNKIKLTHKIHRMKKQISFFLIILLYANTAVGQTRPNWLQLEERERNYPNSVFITGYTPGNVRDGETKAKAETRLRNDALAYVTEAILVKVSSEKQKRDIRIKTQTGKEDAQKKSVSEFESKINTSSGLELAGVKTESYVDSEGLIHAFAYVNRYELTGYYNASLTMNMQQLESVLNTAKQLETNGEKSKARKQYEEAEPLLVKVEQAQDVLIALDNNATAESVQRNKTAAWRSEIIQASARLSQGVYVYVKNSEDLFGQKMDIVANKVKADLARNGCSFTDNEGKADFKLSIKISTRLIGNQGSLIFCSADTQIELYDVHKQKVVYGDEITQKGGSISQEKAGRIAMNNVVPQVVEKLMSWVKN